MNDKTNEQKLVPINEPPHNINDGLEFRDDAIRTKDQPLLYSKENVSHRRAEEGCRPAGYLYQ